MKNLFKQFWNWLFPCRNFPSSLAEELSIKTPYTVEQLQPMIDFIKTRYGFDKDSKEAEETHIVKERSYKSVLFAMENALSLATSAALLCSEKIIIDKNEIKQISSNSETQWVHHVEFRNKIEEE